MKMRRPFTAMLLTLAATSVTSGTVTAQCCLTDLFAGCGTCLRKPPAYAVAPIAAPIPAPPPPVMVPVQQTSYVPETTYRTEYKTVPVTTYKPSCEIDPCTGCPRDCMQPVTQYMQQAVNVPVTQYRAVTSTKYVQMQQAAPGYYGAPAGYAAPVAAPVGTMVPGPAAPAASPFAAPMTTTPQAWGAAGSDVSNTIAPGSTSINTPTLPATQAPPTFQQRPLSPPTSAPIYVQPGAAYGQPAAAAAQPPMTYAQPQAAAPPSPEGTTVQRPTYTAPPLKPIPVMPRGTADAAAAAGQGSAPVPQQASPAPPALPATPAAPVPAPSPSGSPTATGTNGMPVIPGAGPTGATHAFPRLLEPTSHTTSWQPAAIGIRPATFVPAYPTAALPSRLQQ